MTNRELSEKLSRLAFELENISIESPSKSVSRRTLTMIAGELHDLSNENFTPGGASWPDLRKQVPKKKQRYVNTAGKTLPF